MSDKTKHVTPNAPRTLSDKPISLMDAIRKGGSGSFRLTRGTPIERIPFPESMSVIRSPSEETLVDKLNEVIDRINAMNEVPSND